MSPNNISARKTTADFAKQNGKTTEVKRILLWIFRLIFAFGILESLRIFRTSFHEYRSQIYSFLFEVDSNDRVPWGVYVLGELVKKLNAWTRRSDGTMNRKLADLIEFKVAASENPKNGVSSKDVVIDDETNVWVRVYSPSEDSDDQPRPVLVYYHGGGFGVLCANEKNIDHLCRTMARTCNIVVVSVNYRRAPEHRYPAAYQDSFQALEWLQSSASRVHLPRTADISQCFLAGDSAGANIAHFMACHAAEKVPGLFPLRIRGLVLLQPFFGSERRTKAEIALANVPLICTDATDWHWKAFLPEGADRDHPACNVVGPHARDLAEVHLPPIFLVTGTLDPLTDHHLNYASRMREMGKSIKVENYSGGVHGFFFFAPIGTKISSACLADVNDFIQLNSRS